MRFAGNIIWFVLGLAIVIFLCVLFFNYRRRWDRLWDVSKHYYNVRHLRWPFYTIIASIFLVV